jgi:hypothetical protein
MTANLKTEEIPAGGIADFVMTDEQIEQLEAEELKEQFGTNGIAQFSDVGKKMANFGRYGDDTVAHVETGELIVPRALIENNPALKESIFNHLRELGVEDPERYVVGEVKNSVNPTTGLPEFFFKKLIKSVSKIAKGVGKALKKAAPIILPIALAMTPLGPVYGAALGSGIGTLVQGGSTEDALKNAFIAGASGAAFSGARGTLAADLSSPMARFDQTVTGFGNTLTGEGFTGQGNLFSSYQAPTSEISTSELKEMIPKSENYGKKTDMSGLFDKTKKPDFTLSSEVPRVTAGESLSKGNYMDAFTGGENVTAADVLKANNIDIATLKSTDAVYKEAVKKAAELSPGFIAKAGPSLALATATGAAGGFFDAPEEEPMEEIRTGMDVYDENPDIYNVANLEPLYIEGDPRVDSKYPYYVPQAAAEGGEIFPRRVGGIMPDEGIPDKDSVRAMLMPGEFVMTTDAVKGLGGGDMNKGINNMYSVMRNLEQRGKAMA